MSQSVTSPTLVADAPPIQWMGIVTSHISVAGGEGDAMNRTGLIRAALAVLLMGTAVCAPAAVWAAQQTDAQAGVQESAAQVDVHGDAVPADAQDADAMAQQDDRSSDFVIDENGVLTAYLGAGGDVVVPDGVI